MSTISFPDWLNSLSPQSTDGKNVYQQDGSTPSRGDLDEKASLSLTGSDSNGRWVKIYTGDNVGILIQFSTVTLTFTSGSNLTNTWTFPESFLNADYSLKFTFQGGTGSVNPFGGDLGSDNVLDKTTTSATLRKYRVSDTQDFLSNDVMNVDVVAIGQFDDSI